MISTSQGAAGGRFIFRLVQNISTLASVFHRIPESFVTRLRTPAAVAQEESSEEEASVLSDGEHRAKPEDIKAALSAVTQYHSEEEEGAQEAGSDASSSSSAPSDLLDLGAEEEDEESSEEAPTATVPPLPRPAEWPILLRPDVPGTNGKAGVGIRGFICRRGTHPFFHLSVTNQTGVPLAAAAWAIQINKNSFGFAPQQPTNLGLPDLPNGQTAETTVPLNVNVNLSQTPPPFPLTLQVALRTSLDVFYLAPVPFDVSVVLTRTDAVDKDVFRTHWARMGTEKQASFMGLLSSDLTPEEVARILGRYQLGFIVSREQETFTTFYMSAVTTNKLLLLFEISMQKAGRGIKLSIRADAMQMFPILQDFFTRALSIGQIRQA